MTETNNDTGIVSLQGVLNWIFLLVVFSIITAIGNYLGYRHPLSESLIGMGILSLIALLGIWMGKILPMKIPSIVYIIFIGVTLALPLMPTSDIVIHYVSEVEILSIVTVFLAYVGIGMGNRWSEIKALDWKGVIVAMLIVSLMYIGSAMIMQVV